MGLKGRTMKTLARYQFSEIPNTDEGRELLRLMRKYLNRERYSLRARGQHLKQGLDWRSHRYGQGLKDSTHIRIYINEHRRTPLEEERRIEREAEQELEFFPTDD